MTFEEIVEITGKRKHTGCTIINCVSFENIEYISFFNYMAFNTKTEGIGAVWYNLSFSTNKPVNGPRNRKELAVLLNLCKEREFK